MSSLTELEKLKLEAIFSMSGGYVMDFTDRSFGAFIQSLVSKNIHDSRYTKFGTSKANKLRAFWALETDRDTGKITEQMLERLEGQLSIDGKSGTLNTKLFKECQSIAKRLLGKTVHTEPTLSTEADFLKREVDEISVSTLKLDSVVCAILEQRIIEVKKGLGTGTPLSVIFLCGSIMEGLLLGIAVANPKDFNTANAAPRHKDSNKVKQFQEWSLSNFIDVAHEKGYLGLDVKKYSHSLRDFRNFIHPYEQMSSGFTPDVHTAKISWQVLKAAINDIHIKMK